MLGRRLQQDAVRLPAEQHLARTRGDRRPGDEVLAGDVDVAEAPLQGVAAEVATGPGRLVDAVDDFDRLSDGVVAGQPEASSLIEAWMLAAGLCTLHLRDRLEDPGAGRLQARLCLRRDQLDALLLGQDRALAEGCLFARQRGETVALRRSCSGPRRISVLVG